MKKDRKKKHHIFSDSARQAAEDIFGVAFDYDEFEGYGDDEEAERSDGIFFPRGAEPLSPGGSEHPPRSSQGDTPTSAFLVHFPKHGRLAALSRSRTGYFIFV